MFGEYVIPFFSLTIIKSSQFQLLVSFQLQRWVNLLQIKFYENYHWTVQIFGISLLHTVQGELLINI